jgi:hypothetical protein
VLLLHTIAGFPLLLTGATTGKISGVITGTISDLSSTNMPPRLKLTPSASWCAGCLPAAPQTRCARMRGEAGLSMRGWFAAMSKGWGKSIERFPVFMKREQSEGVE